MAEEGSFRTSFSGFHKADVLAYIDTVNSRHEAELQERAQETEQLRQAVSAQEAYVAELKQQYERAARDAEELRQQNEELRRQSERSHRQEAECHRLSDEAEILRMEKEAMNVRLEGMQKRLDAVSSLEEELAGLRRQEQEWTARCERSREREEEETRAMEALRSERDDLARALEEADVRRQAAERERDMLRESNRRYEALSGDVGAFVMELHSMGQRFLEIAYKRSDACLNAVESAVGSLSSRLGEARAQTDQARQELLDQGATAGMRLDELVQKLEESALQPNTEKNEA